MHAPDLDANDEALEAVRSEVEAAVRDIYTARDEVEAAARNIYLAASRLQSILDTRMPELRKRGDV